MNKRIVLMIVALCLVSSLLTGIIVYAVSPSEIQVFSGGIFNGDASYTLYTIGSTFYAKNLNGQVEFSDSVGETVLQDCIDALRSGNGGATGRDRASGKIVFATDFTITDQIDLTDLAGLELSGYSKDWGATININSNADVIFDCVHSRALTFKYLKFLVSASYDPTNIFLLARNADGDSAGDFVFEGCTFNSYESDGADVWIYNYGSESNFFHDCRFYCQKRAVIITERNADSVASVFETIDTGSQSMLQTSFIQVGFSHPASCTDPFIEIDAGGQHHFQDCFWGSPDQTEYAFNLLWTADYETVEGLWIDESRFECNIIETESASTSNVLQNFVLRDCYCDTGNGQELINLDVTAVYTDGCLIEGLRLEGSGCFLQFYHFRHSKLDLTRQYLSTEPYVNITQLDESVIDMYQITKLSISGSKYGLWELIGRKAGEAYWHIGPSDTDMLS